MMRRIRPAMLLGAWFFGLSALPAWAQGLIVVQRHPMPIARSYEVREVTVDARIRDQVADVQISQTFHNPGSTQIESEFLFPLPEEGAIQNFVLMVDGREPPWSSLAKGRGSADF